MQNAALYFHPNGFDTTTGRLLGRHSAGESFLKGFLRHAQIDQLHLWNVASTPLPDLEALLRRIGEPKVPVRWIAARDREALREPGVLYMPGPVINDEAWLRRVGDRQQYAICGITHTTATAMVMNTVANLLIAPTEDYDALICTSSAVRASVESQLDGVRQYLKDEFGPRRRKEPQRATIPLGVNTDDFVTTPEQRKAWRERLDIPEDAPVALYVGRFNILEKMNPALMAIALEASAKALGRPIYWVNSGWAENAEAERIYHEQTRALCPSVRYIAIDGREPDVRFSIWSVADFFISFSDNIQETFGLTPIEAMAAGLPCIVTDWNGYKDTVRHGLDGFRIPTLAPGPGAGGDLSFWFANNWISYSNYVGAAAQYTAIDHAAAVQAITSLVRNPDLRLRLGEQARVQAKAVFDWSAIIPQYQALWAEQEARRRAAAPEPPNVTTPFRPDPFTLFAGYPTRHPGEQDRLTLSPGLTLADATARLSNPIASYSSVNRPNAAEVAQILGWLADRPGAKLGELLQIFPQRRRPFIWRGLLWLARYGVLAITPGE